MLYTQDSVMDADFAPFSHSSVYAGYETIFNSVSDSLFFRGHFKLVEHNSNLFLLNLTHGIIYYLGPHSIVSIGRVLLSDEYPKIKGNSLFIEDRDQNRLVFFAPVEWEDTNLPKPNAYYMKEEEMQEYFRYVIY